MRKTAFLFLVFLLSACIALPAAESTPTNNLPLVIATAQNPYAPKPEDLNIQTGGVILISLDLAEQTETTPPRIRLNIFGSLPRACNELRIEVSEPDSQYRIFVEVYSLVDSQTKCENVFQQFEATLLLGIYSAGRYTVWVNNEYIGDFVSNSP